MNHNSAKDNNHFLVSFVSGGFAGCTGATIISPINRIAIVYQATTEPFEYKKAYRLAIKIYKERGIFDFWRGNLSTVLRVYPFSAITFGVYDKLKMLPVFQNQH